MLNDILFIMYNMFIIFWIFIMGCNDCKIIIIVFMNSKYFINRFILDEWYIIRYNKGVII